MLKNGTIKKLNGIVISDPSYGQDVKCRYQSDRKYEKWQYEYSSISRKEKYKDFTFSMIDFCLKLGSSDVIQEIKINEEDSSFSYPSDFKMKEFRIGMDTACFCIGSKTNYDAFGESMAIDTGTDGYLGVVFEFVPSGKSKPVAILFLGNIDGNLISEEELYRSIMSGFDVPLDTDDSK